MQVSPRDAGMNHGAATEISFKCCRITAVNILILIAVEISLAFTGITYAIALGGIGIYLVFIPNIWTIIITVRDAVPVSIRWSPTCYLYGSTACNHLTGVNISIGSVSNTYFAVVRKNRRWYGHKSALVNITIHTRITPNIIRRIITVLIRRNTILCSDRIESVSVDDRRTNNLTSAWRWNLINRNIMGTDLRIIALIIGNTRNDRHKIRDGGNGNGINTRSYWTDLRPCNSYIIRRNTITKIKAGKQIGARPSHIRHFIGSRVP